MRLDFRQLDHIDFTRSVIETGVDDEEKKVAESQHFELRIKPMFDLSTVKAKLASRSLDSALGFKLDHVDSNGYYTATKRLGHFVSVIDQIVHQAVSEMRLNEVSQLSFELDPAFLDESLKTLTTSDTDVVYLDFKFELHLSKIDQESTDKFIPHIYNLTEQELYELALEHKSEAAELYKSGLLVTAFKRYKKSMSYLIIGEQMIKEKTKKSNETIPEEDETSESKSLASLNKQILDAKAQIYSNMALIQTKSKSYDNVITNCTKCLEIDSANVKALYRRGQARLSSNEYEKATEDFAQALKLDPENKDVQQAISMVDGLRKAYEQQMTLRFKKMFS